MPIVSKSQELYFAKSLGNPHKINILILAAPHVNSWSQRQDAGKYRQAALRGPGPWTRCLASLPEQNPVPHPEGAEVERLVRCSGTRKGNGATRAGPRTSRRYSYITLHLRRVRGHYPRCGTVATVRVKRLPQPLASLMDSTGVSRTPPAKRPGLRSTVSSEESAPRRHRQTPG